LDKTPGHAIMGSYGVLLMKLVGFLTVLLLLLFSIVAAGCQPTETKAASGATAAAADPLAYLPQDG